MTATETAIVSKNSKYNSANFDNSPTTDERPQPLLELLRCRTHLATAAPSKKEPTATIQSAISILNALLTIEIMLAERIAAPPRVAIKRWIGGICLGE